MQILEQDQDILKDVTNLTEIGDGDISLGIGRSLSKLASTIVDTGENLFDIFTEGIVDISNITFTATGKVAKSVVGIFDWAGGTSNFILFIINGAIIMYLTIDYYQRKRRKYTIKQSQLQPIVKLKDSAHGAEPPIPTKPPIYRQNTNTPSSIQRQTDKLTMNNE